MREKEGARRYRIADGNGLATAVQQEDIPFPDASCRKRFRDKMSRLRVDGHALNKIAAKRFTSEEDAAESIGKAQGHLDEIIAFKDSLDDFLDEPSSEHLCIYDEKPEG